MRTIAPYEADVSIWLDTLSRQLVVSGEFRKLIGDCSVTGTTLNPTIFAEAMTGSDLYDEELRARAKNGCATSESCSSGCLSTTCAA